MTIRAWLAALLLPTALHVGSARGHDLSADEADLRAAVILGVLRFTEWDDRSDPSGPILICTTGAPASAPPLLSQGAGLRAGGRAIAVENIDTGPGFQPDCDVVVLGPQLDARESRALLAESDGAGALAICDDCRGSTRAAPVVLRRQGERIGFEINLTNAATGGFAFSSDMLELALRVRR